jgi:hypothetical protein
MLGLSIPMPNALVATMIARREGCMNRSWAAALSAARILP